MQTAKPPVAAAPPHPATPASSARVTTPPSSPLLTPAPPHAKPTREEISRRAFDIEEKLGTNWLSKLGIIILVIGVVFFIAYKLRTMGPLGKDMAGFATSIVLLGGGIFLERKSNYRLLGQTVIGGGWALTYFMTYAMYHVSAAKVLDSQMLDSVLLLAVAGAMVAHTLTYNSQTVTGIAFLLGFSTVAISRETVYSLSAGAILAAGLVVICLLRRWYELEVFGILASYLNHFLWLREILDRLGPGHHIFPEYMPSTMLLGFYWVAFRVSYVLRRDPDEREEGLSTLAALLNTGLLLALLKYQSARPELAFWALLVIGAVELALGQLPRIKARRTAFVTLSTVGTALMIAAVPFRQTGGNPAVLWLVEAEALFLVGVFVPEILFRHFGVFTAVLTSLSLLFRDALKVFETRVSTGHESAEWQLAALFAIAVVIFYSNAHWAARRWKALFTTDFERQYLLALSYLGGVLALAGVWLAFPGAWTGVAWTTLALAAAVAAARFEINAVWVQGLIFALSGYAWTLARNLDADERWHGMTLRLITMGVVAALLYVTARPVGLAKIDYAIATSATYTWAASLLVAILALKELPEHWVAVAWAGYALALLLAGRLLKRSELAWQSHCLAVAAFFWTFSANNLELTKTWHGVTLRLITISLVAVLLYACARWARKTGFAAATWISAGHTWAGTLLVALLGWKELQPEWTPVAWAGYALALLLAGRALKRGELAWQSHCLVVATFFWTLANNLEVTNTWHGVTLRLITISLVAILLYVSARWAGMTESAYAGWISAGHTWAGTLLVALLGWKELDSAWTPVSWAAFALVLLLVGRGLKRSELPMQAHCLAAAAFLWALFVNLNSAQPFHGVSLRLVTVTLIAVMLYVATRWSAEPESEYAFHISAAYSWAGSALLTTLMWYQLRAPSVTLGWALFGLVVFELGWMRASNSLRLQAYVAFAAAFLRIFFVNFNAQIAPGEMSVRLYTTLPLAAVFYYAYWRIAGGEEKYDELEQSYSLARWLNYFGAIAVAGMVRFELQPNWVAAGWAAMVVVLLAIAVRTGSAMFLHQGLLLGIAVLFRTRFFNFELPRYYPPGLLSQPALTVGAACGLLLLALPFAFRLREKHAEASDRAKSRFAAFAAGVVRRPEQLLFFIPVGLLTWLLMIEMRKGLITLAWGLEGVSVFLLALAAKERSFRLTGLGLLLLCVGKILLVDVWTLNPSDRYLTFIALGIALLGVSFLYTRYKVTLREYL